MIIAEIGNRVLLVHFILGMFDSLVRTAQEFPSELTDMANLVRSASHRNIRARLNVEHLEDRSLPAAQLTAWLGTDGILRVEGTERIDAISIRQDAGLVSVNGAFIQTESMKVRTVASASVTAIEVLGLGGNDTIRLDRGRQAIQAPAKLDGGRGNDLLAGGAGANQYVLGSTDQDRIVRFGSNDSISWSDPANVVKSKVRSTDLAILTLRSDGGVYINGRKIWGNVADFAIDNAGKVILLGRNKTLEKQTATGWQTLASNVTRFAFRGSDNAILWQTGNSVFTNGNLTWSGVSDFSLDRNQRVILLGTNHRLERQTDTGWELLGEQVSKFILRVSDNALLWQSGSAVYTNGNLTWDGVADFALDAQEHVIHLGTNHVIDCRPWPEQLIVPTFTAA